MPDRQKKTAKVLTKKIKMPHSKKQNAWLN